MLNNESARIIVIKKNLNISKLHNFMKSTLYLISDNHEDKGILLRTQCIHYGRYRIHGQSFNRKINTIVSRHL